MEVVEKKRALALSKRIKKEMIFLKPYEIAKIED